MKKIILKFFDNEGFYRRSRSKDDRVCDGEDEKVIDKDLYYLERKESSWGKGYGFFEELKNRRKWDDFDGVVRVEDSSYVGNFELRSGFGFGFKYESSRERSKFFKFDISEGKDRMLDLVFDKGKSYSSEERKIYFDRFKSGNRLDVVEEDDKISFLIWEDRIGGEKSEKYRE